MAIAHQLETDPTGPNVPALPDVPDADLLTEALTHASYHGAPSEAFENQPGTFRHNKRLAVGDLVSSVKSVPLMRGSLQIIGDAFLKETLILEICKNHPDLTSGGITVCRSLCLPLHRLNESGILAEDHEQSRFE